MPIITISESQDLEPAVQPAYEERVVFQSEAVLNLDLG